MNTLIKTIEDLSLNAWPSHQIELYDGWILRFSYFYTHRTNSVEQIGPSTIPVEEKVQYCEEIYRRWGTPAIFKISPLVNPGFDAMLANRGYVVQHTTHVMTMDLANFAKKNPAVAVTVSSFIPPKWIDSLFALKSTTNVMHRMVVPSMYRAIPKETAALRGRIWTEKCCKQGSSGLWRELWCPNRKPGRIWNDSFCQNSSKRIKNQQSRNNFVLFA